MGHPVRFAAVALAVLVLTACQGASGTPSTSPRSTTTTSTHPTGTGDTSPSASVSPTSGQPLVGETLAEGLVSPVPVGCVEVVVVLRGEVEGVPLAPWQAVSTRTARATAANLTGWPIQYPIPLDSTNPLKELGLKANV